MHKNLLKIHNLFKLQGDRLSRVEHLTQTTGMQNTDEELQILLPKVLRAIKAINRSFPFETKSDSTPEGIKANSILNIKQLLNRIAQVAGSALPFPDIIES